MKKLVIVAIVVAILVTGIATFTVAAASLGKPPMMETGYGSVDMPAIGSVSFGNYPGVAHISLTVVREGSYYGPLKVYAKFDGGYPREVFRTEEQNFTVEFDTYKSWEIQGEMKFGGTVNYVYTVTYPQAVQQKAQPPDLIPK